MDVYSRAAGVVPAGRGTSTGQEHSGTDDDANGQLEADDYGSPFDKILPYVGGNDADRTQLYVSPSDPDSRGAAILDAGRNCVANGAPPPGPLSSYVLNAYYLFGATEARISTPSQSIHIAERRSDGDKTTDFRDVHYHPWTGESESPTSTTDRANPAAIASSRHSGGGNYVYADGHAKWHRFEDTRRPFDGHALHGEHQAF